MSEEIFASSTLAFKIRRRFGRTTTFAAGTLSLFSALSDYVSLRKDSLSSEGINAGASEEAG